MQQETHWGFLKSSALLGKLSHAYMFSGNDETGQQRLVIKLSQLLNCESKKKERPCGECASCRALQAKTHPDAVWIAQTQEIPISAIRSLRQHFALSPWQSSFKIAVIEKAHLMNMEAQSAILKLLEEPSRNAVLFLLTRYPGMLLDIIRSRVQEIRWYAFPAASQEGLEGREELRLLKSSLIQERFDYAKKAAETQEDAIRVLEKFLKAQRLILLEAVSGSMKSAAQDERILQTIQKMLYAVQTTNVTPRLAVEQVLLEL